MKFTKFFARVLFVFLLSSSCALPGDTPIAAGINSIDLTSHDGWKLCFRSDGSAEVFFSAGPNDWRTAPDLFDLDLIEAEVRPLLESAKGAATFKSGVSIYISREPRKPGFSQSVENSEVIQNLFRKVLPNIGGIENGERFRKLVQISPPFGISGVVIRDDQIGIPPRRSLTRYRESIYPRELTGEEDLSKFTIDRKSRAYVESLRKKRSAKDPSAKEEDGNEPLAKEASVPGGHGGDARATPWWFVIAGAVAVVVGLVWVLLRGKTSKGA